jgi:hypothetical protein
MNNLTRVLLALVVMSTMNGCLLKKTASGDVIVEEEGSGAVSGGGNGSVAATPTPNGMYCEGKGGGSGGDSAQQYDASNGRVFISNKIAGSFVNSVKLKIKIGATSGGTYIGTSTTYSTPMTLKLYTCGASGSKGSLQGTATSTVGLYGEYKTITFNFSTPVAIPTVSGCGSAYAAVFEFIGNANMANQQLLVESEIAGSSCDARFSTAQGVSSSLSPRAWGAIIATSP